MPVLHRQPCGGGWLVSPLWGFTMALSPIFLLWEAENFLHSGKGAFPNETLAWAGTRVEGSPDNVGMLQRRFRRQDDMHESRTGLGSRPFLCISCPQRHIQSLNADTIAFLCCETCPRCRQELPAKQRALKPKCLEALGNPDLNTSLLASCQKSTPKLGGILLMTV